jgi:Mg2+-importing ATPase
MVERAGDETWWSCTEADLLRRFESGAGGLASADAQRRLQRHGPNRLTERRRLSALRVFAAQFGSPLILILVFAAAVSLVTGDWVDAWIVLAIIAASSVLSFVQEYAAGHAVERLLSRIRLRATTVRDGRAQAVDAEVLVPGDVVLLAAGSLVPADGRVLEADDFFVSEAVLTGETFPAEKRPGTAAPDAGLASRTNAVFHGTSVRSGTARVLVTATGSATEYGRIAGRLSLRPPQTEFERGVRQFGQMLTQLMTLLVLAIFAANVAYARPIDESLLFAVALAVGLAPELLPAIIAITLSRGAMRMARAGVIVRRLSAIEDFGAMNVLATDKTGTLTVGVVRLDAANGPDGTPSEQVQRLAQLNARLQTGLPNPLDEAIVAAREFDLAPWRKMEEIPYDFVRKRLSIAVRPAGEPGSAPVLLITKGALEPLLTCCSGLRRPDGTAATLDATALAGFDQRAAAWAEQGYRVLGVATRELPPRAQYLAADETGMVFEGFLLFFDPPKPDAARAIADLRRLGVRLKIVTGDNRRVAEHVAAAVGLPVRGVVTGAQMRDLHDEALWHVARRATIFAEVDPNQKERIVTALRRTGHVVGYLGDGINDAPALHAADVGISVDGAVDVARESADLVLLDRSLGTLREGVLAGRRVFVNTLKYIYTTTSANFGNMLSMAGLSLVLPFLPLLPKQILLNNFLSDVPAMALAGDRVDRTLIARPRRWDIRQVRRFMLVFGLISSVFDVLTFVVLLAVLNTARDEFRTAWFVESLLTELGILLIVRTRGPFLRSRPGPAILWITVLVAAVAIGLPYVPPAAELFGFVPLPPWTLAALLSITLAYLAANEVAKRLLRRRFRL